MNHNKLPEKELVNGIIAAIIQKKKEKLDRKPNFLPQIRTPLKKQSIKEKEEITPNKTPAKIASPSIKGNFNQHPLLISCLKRDSFTRVEFRSQNKKASRC